MDSTPTYYGYLSMEDFLQLPITFFLAIMSTEVRIIPTKVPKIISFHVSHSFSALQLFMYLLLPFFYFIFMCVCVFILGKQSLETICLLLAYKIKYPENFFLLRGNHECASINRIYGNFTPSIFYSIFICNAYANRFIFFYCMPSLVFNFQSYFHPYRILWRV